MLSRTFFISAIALMAILSTPTQALQLEDSLSSNLVQDIDSLEAELALAQVATPPGGKKAAGDGPGGNGGNGGNEDLNPDDDDDDDDLPRGNPALVR